MCGLMLLCLGGCGGTQVIQGFKLNADKWREDEAKIKARAAFDLQCPESQLTMRILGTMANPMVDDWVEQVGVRGCGRQGVYVRSANGGFLLNSEKQSAPSVPPASE